MTMIPKDISRKDLVMMVNKYNQSIGIGRPIDLDLPFDELMEEMVMRILETLPEGAMDPKPGQPMDSKDIALENYLKERDIKSPIDDIPEN